MNATDWQPPHDWIRLLTVDAHTAGEPLRVIIDGFPELKGNTILARRRYARDNHDDLRKALMWEPRGHADMYGCILTPAVTPEADFGVLFTHNEGFSTMCGHGIIAVTKVVLDTGMLPAQEPETVVRIDTPAGLVTAHARVSEGLVSSVYFHNVPSFVLSRDLVIQVPQIGALKTNIAFGGAFYAFVEAAEAGVTMTSDCYKSLIETGMNIKHAAMEQCEVIHPFEPELSFLYGTIFTGPALGDSADSRNVCVFADGEVDRSPTGTGVSARLALYYSKGDIQAGESIIIESIIGSSFAGRVVETTRFGPHDAVIPEIEGTAYITGRHEFLIDPKDPLKDGFVLR